VRGGFWYDLGMDAERIVDLIEMCPNLTDEELNRLVQELDSDTKERLERIMDIICRKG
jgi:hypothetical protein